MVLTRRGRLVHLPHTDAAWPTGRPPECQLIAYRGTGNLGDVIQTVAISQLFPHAVAVFRDEMDKADPTIPLIVNGWIGNSGDRGVRLPSGGEVRYCGIHAPHDHFRSYKFQGVIGARDPYTEAKLKRYGLMSEFIGCATMLFPRHNGPRAGVYSVDCDGPGKQVSHGISPGMSWDDQWEMAMELLDLYRRAEMVHTSRLHAALPCIAFGTPVVIVRPDAARFSILARLHVNCAQPVVGVDLRAARERYIRFLESAVGYRLPIVSPRFPNLRCASAYDCASSVVHVCTATDSNFAPHLDVLLRSVSENTAGTVKFHVLARGLPDDMKRGLLRPASPKTTVHLVDTSKMLMGLSPKLLPHTSLATMDRILLPALLPDVSKVIYLDGDTVVPGDLSALYRQETSSRGIAAKSSILPDYRTLGKLVRIWARDPSRVLSEVRIDPAASCFNNGVMLLDLDILRAHRFVDIALDLATKYGLNDQLIFNIYAAGDYARLDASWNVFVGQDAPPTKNIIHWVGPRKPWSVPGVPLAEFWRRYCR